MSVPHLTSDADLRARTQALEMVEFRARLHRLRRHGVPILATLVVGGAIGAGVSFAVKPTFQSSVVFIPPQQQQGGASGALAQLGALSSLVGDVGAVKNATDQYISMLVGTTASDSVIKRFRLNEVYDTPFKDEARKMLAKRVQVSGGKKDGLIRVDVEDVDPQRAAAMANDYVDELRLMTSHLAVTEAQQRRVFFERLLEDAQRKLVAAQVALEATGFSAGALKAEPRTAADTYAKLKAELTAAQVKLQVMQTNMADTSPDLQRQSTMVSALSGKIAGLEASESSGQATPDYVGKYREFKYQETLFDLYSKQYELARVDESREGSLIQVVDPAEPAEHKHAPRRSLFTAAGAMLGGLVALAFFWRRDNASSVPVPT